MAKPSDRSPERKLQVVLSVLRGERLRDINAYMAHLDGLMVFCCASDAEAVV